MTTTDLTPYRSRQSVGRDGFAQLVRAEFTKFRSVRAWVVTLGIAAVLVVVFAWVGAPHANLCVERPGSPQSCATPSVPRVPLGPGGEPVVDTFSYLHQPMSGDGSLTVEVTSLAVASGARNRAELGPDGPVLHPVHPGLVPWAKAGLVVTENTTQGSPYAAVMVTSSHGVRLQYDYTGDVAGLPGAVTSASPRWLRLTRVGDVITAYDSLEGTHWSRVGSVSLAGLPTTVQIGLFVTSPAVDGSASLATATFEQLHLDGSAPTAGWRNEVVGADTQSYTTVPTGRGWFEHSNGRFIISGSGDIAPQVSGVGPLSAGGTLSLLVGGTFGLIAIIVLATLFITSEYRRGLIRTTFSASPRRGRILAAKAVVIGSVTFVAASIATAVAAAVSRHVLPANGNYVFPLGAATEV